ncbi:hypothetical protein [Brevundimonas subvibrioides]|uniref:Uncharacterized protein n=1 Tax=Brevundimonas subvibrioides (strain ATCC 15264 / DSM 4735 / LMG 14903 / NBRC 16000 / CB 81) TaxID=633149 RepID=D9QJK4_BRESC|nr:hypothetical protein [Brevundimonas subvibrioides]ADL01565.1 conserved hypothetical protein [Brevundimonas subvibrioides ATCC 15264]
MKKSSLTVGVDVPWVTSWTGEILQGVRPCASVGGRLALTQAEHAGYGRPEYSKNHLLRQRLTVTKMLCPMCGEATAPDDRVTQVARRIPAGRLRASGRGAGLSPHIGDEQVLIDAGAIAPLHRRCSDLSLQHCPHLRAEPDIDVRPFPARWTILPLLIEAIAPRPAGHALIPGMGAQTSVPVVTFLQLCGVSEEVDRAWRTRRKAA